MSNDDPHHVAPQAPRRQRKKPAPHREASPITELALDVPPSNSLPVPYRPPPPAKPGDGSNGRGERLRKTIQNWAMTIAGIGSGTAIICAGLYALTTDHPVGPVVASSWLSLVTTGFAVMGAPKAVGGIQSIFGSPAAKRVVFTAIKAVANNLPDSEPALNSEEAPDDPGSA
jgi:hypothetical protein